MKTFKRYLLLKGFAETTVLQHERNIGLFNNWIKTNSVDLMSCTYPDIVRFIDHSAKYQNINPENRNRINRILASITYYYEFLSERNLLIANPAKYIRIKNNHSRIKQRPIEYDELLTLYRQRHTITPRDVRNQVILGFLIFQGMTVGELNKLTIEDILLREGMVLIKEGGTNNLKKTTTTRVLPLDAVQVIDLLEYLNIVRPKILSGRLLETPGRNPGKGKRLRRTNRMILSLKGSPFIKNTLHHLFIDIRKLHPMITSAKKIRESIITHWLSLFDIRKVQYMAGHRYVSSTEWYKPSDLEDLKREINKFHPLK